MGDGDENAGQLLTPGDVAEAFAVSSKTVARWADAGKLSAIRTLGGHRRFDAQEVRDLLDQRSSRNG